MNFNPTMPFFRYSRTTPDNVALFVNEKEYSYFELGAYASSVSAWLRNVFQDPGNGFKVAILASRSLETYAGILGTCWAGATYIPISIKASAASLKSVLEQTSPTALIVDENGVKKLSEIEIPANCKVLYPDEFKALLPNDVRQGNYAREISEPQSLSADEIAYIIFTSGTTGVPKGVMIRTGSLYKFIGYMQTLYQIGSEDRISNFSEVSFDFSVLDLWLTWFSGASLHVVPSSQIMAPSRFIQQQKLTFWASVPSAITFLTRLGLLKEGCFPSLRVSYFCGEPLPFSSAKAWKKAAPNSVIDNHYGPTEATVACSMHRLSDNSFLANGRDIISIGKPYPEMRMAIVDDEKRFLSAPAKGELVIAGPQLTSGYLEDETLTSKRLKVLNHPLYGPMTWYLTGDLAFEDKNGEFHHLGRIDNQVKILGHRVELEELDAQLRRICGVDTVATVAWPIKEGLAEGIVAFVSQSKVCLNKIQSILRENLPPWVLPREILSLEEIPLTANGKIDRKALVKLLSERSPNSDKSEPSAP